MKHQRIRSFRIFIDAEVRRIYKTNKLGELNDLVKDLNLLKMLQSFLDQGSKAGTYFCRECLPPGLDIVKLLHFQFVQDDDLVYCTNIKDLMDTYKISYNPAEWRIFIDSLKRSLKAVLLHNGGFYTSIPVGHSVHLKETYKNLELVLCKLKYKDHGWKVCGDLKILGMLLAQQSGFTKFPFFLCLWDSRDRANHWTKKCWPSRELKVGEKNVLHETLVPPHKVLLPPLHIKLGLMKQFVKSLPRDGNCFKYLISKFPGLSEAKLKESVFVGPDIRRLMDDSQFITAMTDPQKEGYTSEYVPKGD